MHRKRVLIIGAAGRDFHNFNTVYRTCETHEVVAFTATQIPEIDDRRYPAVLSGGLYPDGIPIEPMEKLEQLIGDLKVDECVFSYSDIHYVDLMQLGNRVLSAGADFKLLAPARGHVKSVKPVIAVLAVRTGCGKSQTTRRVVEILKGDLGVEKVVSIRHPMPYGDLAKQAVQRFASVEDLAKHKCTIEEMEEYEPHIAVGNVIYAGVDYEAILREAEKEADVIIWDGGNNDPSFYDADVTLCVADPLRAGHELLYWAGETNLTMADAIVLRGQYRDPQPGRRRDSGRQRPERGRRIARARQARPGRRGRPDADSWRDGDRRRLRGQRTARRYRDRRPAAVCGRQHQGRL